MICEQALLYQFLQHLINLRELAALDREVFAAGENPEEQNFRLRRALLKFFDDGRDTFGDLSGRIIFAV